MAGEAPFVWKDNQGVHFKKDNMNLHIDRTLENLLKNHIFNAWSEGVSTDDLPDGWNAALAGGHVLCETASAHVETGTRSVKITKTSGDAGVTYFRQYLRDFMLPPGWYTFLARIKADVLNKVKAYISIGGVNYNTTYNQTVGAFETLAVTAQITTPHATDNQFGIFVEKEDINVYLDSVILVRGKMAPLPAEGPGDRSLQCYYWEHDDAVGGTPAFERCGGGVRKVGFKITGTLTGGSAKETIPYTMVHGCERIIYVRADAIAFGTSDYTDVSCRCGNYGAGGGEDGFDINLYNHAGAFTASETFEIRGEMLLLGWDSYSEVHGV